MQETRFTRSGRETLELAGQTFDTIVLDSMNLKTAVKIRLWLDVTDGHVVRVNLPNGRNIYLSDASVVKKIEAVNLDSTITAKVDVSIPDSARSPT